MKLEDFNNIDFNNVGNLPVPVKAVLLFVEFLIIVVLGYYFLWSPALESLDKFGQKKTSHQLSCIQTTNGGNRKNFWRVT